MPKLEAGEPPPSSELPTWSVPLSAPQAKIASVGPWRRRALLAAAVLSSIALVGFAVATVDRVRGDRSLDFVANGIHLGFYGMEGVKRWTCGEGHDHWSAPYWVGLLGLGGLVCLVWSRWARAHRRRGIAL